MALPRTLLVPAAALALGAAVLAVPVVGHGTAHAGSASTRGLDPELARRLQLATAAARAAGVPLEVTSGWRSAEHQQQLLDQAVRTYGSLRAATQWVLPPRDSEHVRGEAVDVGPAAGRRWLQEHGAAYGLCRRYANEPWHFEPLVAPGGHCPPLEPHAVATSV